MVEETRIISISDTDAAIISQISMTDPVIFATLNASSSVVNVVKLYSVHVVGVSRRGLQFSTYN